MARDNTLTLVLVAVGGYLLYTHYLSPTAQATAAVSPAPGAAAGSGILCKFPDWTTTPQASDGTCPYDASHGGQSTPCYPTNFVGAIPQGGATC